MLRFNAVNQKCCRVHDDPGRYLPLYIRLRILENIDTVTMATMVGFSIMMILDVALG
jgi:hypothetical protein